MRYYLVTGIATQSLEEICPFWHAKLTSSQTGFPALTGNNILWKIFFQSHFLELWDKVHFAWTALETYPFSLSLPRVMQEQISLCDIEASLGTAWSNRTEVYSLGKEVERNVVRAWGRDLTCLAAVGRKDTKAKWRWSSSVGKSCCLQVLAMRPVSHGGIDVMVTRGSALLRHDGFRGQRMVLVVVQPTAGGGILLITKQGSNHPSFQGEGRDLCGEGTEWGIS